MIHLTQLFGIAGVKPTESTTAIALSRFFEIVIIFLLLWFLIDSFARFHSKTWIEQALFSDWFIWFFFIVETMTITILCKDRLFYLRTNWMNLVIIGLGFGLLFSSTPSDYSSYLRVLRVLVFFSLFGAVPAKILGFLNKNHLGATLLAALLMVILSGFFIAILDPALDTPIEGLWWAWVTMTTVGYGDYAPVSIPGRIFAAVLMLCGILVVSVITANFSAAFLSKEEEEISENEKKIFEKLESLEKQISELHGKIDNIQRESKTSSSKTSS
ncbi:MAG: ion channel [Pseudomonadota bacterium]